jgi:hypothetical protein
LSRRKKKIRVAKGENPEINSKIEVGIRLE